MPELIEDLLPKDEAEAAFYALRPDGNEIQYEQCYALGDDQSLVPLPRLMAFQASINECGDFPWYRCKLALVAQNKIDYIPWTPTVQKIKDFIERKTNQTWNLAHIIYYRDGDDSMGMHSDSMLDLAQGSTIAIVSLGSTRQMDLLKKQTSNLDGPTKMKFDMSGNSLFLLDDQTNQHYVHGIRKMKKNHVEDRISIVFRNVTTFKTDHELLYGPDLTFLSKDEIIQREKQRQFFRYFLGFILAILVTFSLPIFSTNVMKLMVTAIVWFVAILLFGQIEQVRSNHTKKVNNERLKELCRMKNFKIWNQTDMRRFLKFS